MNLSRLYIPFFVFTSLLCLINPRAAIAVDYNYPLPVLFKNAQDDPSLLFKDLAATNVNQSGVKDYFNNATVTCIDNPQLARSILTGDIDKIKTTTSGRTSVSTNVIPNFAMDSEKLLTEPTKSFSIRVLSNLWDWYNNFAFQSWCHALNLTDPIACSQQFGNALTNQDGTTQPNILATDPGITKLLNPEQQFIHLVKPRAQEILAQSCQNHPEPCEADYPCGDSGLTSYKAASQVPNSYLEWQNLDSTLRNKVQACMVPSTVVEPGILIIKPELNDASIFQYLFTSPDAFKPSFAVFSLSGANGGSKSSQKEFNYLTTPTKQTELTQQIHQDNFQPLDYSSVQTAKEAALAKISQAGTCTPISLDTIFAGSVAPARLTGTNFFTWFFGLLNAHAAANTYPFKYSIWIITPLDAKLPDYFAQVTKNFLDTSKTALMKPIDVPLPITADNTNPTLTDTYGPDPSPTPCPAGTNCPPVKTQTAELGWQATPNTKTSIPGGYTTQYASWNLSKQNFLPLNHPEYYHTCNYYNETAVRLPILRQLLGSDAQDVNTSCSDPLATTNANLPTDSCTAKMHLFEPTCGGQMCYEAVMSGAASTTCNGKVLNPYYAIAIALNENGGLFSTNPDGSAPDHFGCNPGVNGTIPEKLNCMLNTLVNDCRAGKSDEQTLSEYGYPSGYQLGPLSALSNPNPSLFVSPSEAQSYISTLRNQLTGPYNVCFWYNYYQNIQQKHTEACGTPMPQVCSSNNQNL